MSAKTIAGRFVIRDPKEDLIGWGGMGRVYRGTDSRTGQPVAIKVLQAEVVANRPEVVARFVREGQSLRQLGHPNIVQMVAAVEEEGIHYLVMEYVDGGSLRDLLERQGALPLKRTLEIGLDLSDALTRAHRLGIIHRDLKPANVLLAEDGSPRLTDFGVAHVTGKPRLTQSGLLLGTADYLSPEACNGQPLDERADIWSFGVMLYEMLLGERPFQGDTLMAILSAILTQPVPDLARVVARKALAPLPDALNDLIYRMLEKDPQQRLPSVRLVGAELEAIARQRTTTSSASIAPAVARFAPPTTTTRPGRHNLPAQPTPFVGRQSELAEIARLLADPGVRLLTILGAGGMGKTRLALAAGQEQLDRFIDGVYFFPLAPLRSAEAIVPLIAEALGFSFYQGPRPRRQLLDYLQPKAALLILDNLEHLPKAADLVVDLLREAPAVKILATSRVRLQVQGEQLFHLAGLDFSDWNTPAEAIACSAAQLFLQSARRVRPAFEIDADNVQDVAHVCRLVQGMPLGIVLAAAWVEMLSPHEIAAEIRRGLDFLETDLRDVAERHRSLRAVLDYSWDLLDERERKVFAALAVFCGGFGRQAAQAVTGASLRDLMALVNKSLLRRAPTGRYEVHELLHQYAVEKLNATEDGGAAIRDRHSAYYTRMMERWGPGVKGADQQSIGAEILAESENTRAAWDWTLDQGRLDRLQEAIKGLGWLYALLIRPQEGVQVFQEAAERLAQLEGSELLRARALTRQAVFRNTVGQKEPARALLQQSLDLLRHPRLAGVDTRADQSFAVHQLGLSLLNDDPDRARALLQQNLDLAQSLQDPWEIAYARHRLALAAWSLADYAGARQNWETSLSILRDLGARWDVAYILGHFSRLPLRLGQYGQAERLIEESLEISRQSEHWEFLGYALFRQIELLLATGRFVQAVDSVTEYERLNDSLGIPTPPSTQAQHCWALVHLGQYTEARTLARQGLALSRERGEAAQAAEFSLILGCRALAEGDFPRAQSRVQERLALPEDVDDGEKRVQALLISALVDCALDRPGPARQALRQALRIARPIEAFLPQLLALPAAARLLLLQSEPARALELYTLARSDPFVAQSRWLEDVAGRAVEEAAAGLPAETAAAARRRGQQRDLYTAIDDIEEELLSTKL
ncbi:MAG: protein kinase [Chloroflexia bacterium]|nr:protein kinase [Chloroflexia bacterium]